MAPTGITRHDYQLTGSDQQGRRFEEWAVWTVDPDAPGVHLHRSTSFELTGQFK
ncbi:hypothetical protein GCM10009634_11550 [Saccharothrix xinjiangensis]